MNKSKAIWLIHFSVEVARTEFTMSSLNNPIGKGSAKVFQWENACHESITKPRTVSNLMPRDSCVSAEEHVGPLLELLADVAGPDDDADGRRTRHDGNRTGRRKLKKIILNSIKFKFKKQMKS